ncbi:Isoquinoline 1-oxidoreductase subunit [Melittangium boletus]|uniref:Ioquinoline 1-oxidoreductase subunit n=1 Tax=Melittangium boletus DSM 14713 TaxID=1294270 RepID=A0A250IRS8_9BACT|nr:Isoquinoline 1-oxidoreductase subunit [Melittangium boletus]ATB34449.1 ioquinoline 1-oxidoreductase subunit [Melittangium boletus DSM 14713]
MRVLPVTLLTLSLTAPSLVACTLTSQPRVSSDTEAAPEPALEPGDALRPVSSFSGIADLEARSVALFTEAGRVITHPRCTNCHPADGVPRQGLEQRPHLPRATGGENGHGPPGLPCAACHPAANTPVVGESLRSVPGNPKWALAPAEMAWVGRSLGSICEQLKDPARNGGKSLVQLQHHMAGDELVAWGWAPGAGRQPVPPSQKVFGELIQAWIDTGAHCPAP